MDDIKAKAFELFIEGKTYQEIGDLLGVSRQRIQQIVRPPKPIYDAVKRRAKDKCEGCGILCSGHVHHANSGVDNFNDLDNLKYLCPSCHRSAHATGINKVRLVVKISPDQKAMLEKMRAKSGVTVSEIVRRLITAALKRA